MRAMPRIYKSFEEFEREELHKLDSLAGSVDGLLDEMFAEELDFEGGSRKKPDADQD